MWTLKTNVKIVLKRHGLIVTKETLEHDQTLAEMILEDPAYNQRYGHNLVQLDAASEEKQSDETTIEVNIKKKEDVPTSQSAASEDTALTFDNAGNDGMALKFKEREPQSTSNASKQHKPTSENGTSPVSSSDASAATSV